MNLETELQNDLEDLGLTTAQALDVIQHVRPMLRPPSELDFLGDNLQEIEDAIDAAKRTVADIRKEIEGL